MQTHIKVRSKRTVNIVSLSGHSAIVEAGVITSIPMAIAEQAFAKGCIPVEDFDPIEASVTEPVEPKLISTLDDSDDVPVDPVVTEPVKAVATTAEAPRRLSEAFDILVKFNDKADFKLDGLPRVAALRRVLGREVSPHEVDVAWALYQEAK